MKSSKLAALAFVLFAAWPGSASASPIDVALTIPLVDISATDLTPTSLLTGTLSYDEEAMSGTGTFSLSDAKATITDSFAGFAFLLPLGSDAIGVLFDATSLGGASLYFNLLAGFEANAFVSSPISFCAVGCAMFQGVGATVMLPGLPPIVSSGQEPLPGGIVSPVPLPPAASLFSTAVLCLGGLGAGRRMVLRARAAAVAV